MPPLYILANQITPMKTTCALKVRCIRTYGVRECSGSEVVKCRECVFHDREGNVLHANIPREHVAKFQNRFVEDVIGRIIEIYSPIEKVIGGRPSRLIDFLMEDESGEEMKCTVWDDHVDKVDSWVKACFNTGETKISSSYDATQLFINEDIPEIIDFRESMCGENTPMRSICSNASLSAVNTFDTFNRESMIMSTISDVYEKRQFGDYWVVAKIVGIESGLDWCYNSCKTRGCNKKLSLNTKGFYDCYKCKRTWGEGILRYRIKVRVVDRDGNASFLLCDSECKELIGMSAIELRGKYPQDKQLFPNEISSLCSMTLIFKISVRKEQFQLPNAFAVMEIINDYSLVGSYCPKLLENFDSDPTSKLESNDCFESDEEFLSEGEGEIQWP
ncbi:PREDICTED: replication protein A 70 kDa DNA-binding subunit A-like [Ipomoea nil]|uniref:replication protein A 70 kDa DNA-binding subunit A-like n=1 Tax=Ipomoea nil TaxID=35883 RepID=UPI000901421A|nr:PREDICTED: replication protein A 70 kDa DNA-binding subunit A-like [Ipomoea nil]